MAKKEKKIDIPKDFLKKIKKLGMKEEDAEILFRSKIDWAAVYSSNKILCTEPACDYHTKIEGGDLKNHLISVHNYGEYPCRYSGCNFIGVSEVRYYLFFKLLRLNFSVVFVNK